MTQRNDKLEKLDSGALSNTLYILIRNEAEGRVKDNYSSEISAEFELSQGGVSNNLKRLEEAGIIDSQKQGRKKVYKVNWSNLSDLAFTHSESMYYFDMPEEELYDIEELVEEDYDNVGEIYEEFLEALEEISDNKEFEEFLEKVLTKYTKKVDIEKNEAGRFKNPSLSVVFNILVSVLSVNGNYVKNQIEAIQETSDITEEQAIDSLRVEEDKKEFLKLIREIWYQHNYVEGAYTVELEELEDIIKEVFDDYFDVYSRKPLMIEKDFLDRLP